jgi:hypothetical protein
VVILVFGLLVAGALAADSAYQTATARFKQRLPGKPTAARLEIDYVNPADRDGKPPAVKKVVVKLARGARIDTSVPALCKASDAELMAEGASACPAASKVGQGEVTVDTGFPGPGRFVDADVDFFNNTDELIFLNTVKGSDARTVIRATAGGRRTVTEAPMLPGTPPDGGAIDTVHIVLFAVTRRSGGERHAYITTPPRCPRVGHWVNSVGFTYANGVNQTVKSSSPCRRPS